MPLNALITTWPIWVLVLLKITPLVIFGAIASKGNSLSIRSTIYLYLVPGLIFFQQDLLISFLALPLGIIIFRFSATKHSLKPKHQISLLLLALLIIIATKLIYPSSAKISFANLGLSNSINTLRGEHYLLDFSQTARLLHNKLNFFWNITWLRISHYLSPLSLFISYPFGDISPYYPLGIFFFWDVIFLVKYLLTKTFSLKTIPLIFFTLLLIISTEPGPFAQTIALGITYFFAILISQQYAKLSKTAFSLMTILNLLFILLISLTLPAFYFS